MSSRSRRDPDGMREADAQAAALLAADADGVREARDWRAEVAGGPPEVVARDATPDRWNCYTQFGIVAAREIAKIAEEEGMTPAEYVRETVLADVSRRTTIELIFLRQKLTRTTKPRRRAPDTMAKALRP